MENTIYNLNLHEGRVFDGIYIVRVPGGWVYNFGNNPVFVPYNNEFSVTPPTGD